jgi:hypothetical protein
MGQLTAEPDEEEAEAAGVQKADPGAETKPWSQLRQTVALKTALKVFWGQSRHDVEPGRFWKRPTVQAKQAMPPMLGWMKPARHSMQVERPTLGFTWPTEQGMQKSAPWMFE